MGFLRSFFGVGANNAGLETKASSFTYGGDAGYGGGLYGQWPWLMPSTRIDFTTEAGDPSQNSIIMACVNWVCRTFPQAPIQVLNAAAKPADAKQRLGQSKDEIVGHPLTKLLRQPNDFYNGLLLWQATLAAFNLDGNAYWLKHRGGMGQVAELWYEPTPTIRPVWPPDGSEFISGYRVMRGGLWSENVIPRSEVVHFRNGIDPNNPRLGRSPLAAALREIFTDNEAAAFTASLLRNFAVPSILISPATPEYIIDDPAGLKRTIMAGFTADRRGEPMVMGGPTKAEMVGFSPEQLALDVVRNIPEERICALLGVPAIVAGMGSGLEHATYSNFETALAQAYRDNIIPTQMLLAAQLDTDLLSELGDPDTEEVAFDLSGVSALSEDQNDIVDRLSHAYQGGWMKRSEARLLSPYDLDVDGDDDVYITDVPKPSVGMTEEENPGTLLGLLPNAPNEGAPPAPSPGVPIPGTVPVPVGATAPHGSNGNGAKAQPHRHVETKAADQSSSDEEIEAAAASLTDDLTRYLDEQWNRD